MPIRNTHTDERNLYICKNNPERRTVGSFGRWNWWVRGGDLHTENVMYSGEISGWKCSLFVRMCVLCVFQKIDFPSAQSTVQNTLCERTSFVCVLNNWAVIIRIKPNGSISTRLWVSEFIHTYTCSVASAPALFPHRSFNRTHIHARNINKSIEIKRFRCFFFTVRFILFVGTAKNVEIHRSYDCSCYRWKPAFLRQISRTNLYKYFFLYQSKYLDYIELNKF